jgi:hypothetical protein
MPTPIPLHSCLKLAPLTLALTLVLALSACGGGGGGGGEGGGVGGNSVNASLGNAPVIKTLQTGTFVDSAVAGLSYTTTSGMSGVTDAAGHFTFKEGDAVTFSLSGVVLGSTAGAGLITPAHLANGEDTDKFSNLLILLQSLDTDGNPDNGITLPTGLAKGAIEAVVSRLNDDPKDFENATQNSLLASIAHGGVVRTKEAAARHYEQAQGAANAFFDDASGVWRATTPAGTELILRLTTSGRYVLSTVPLAEGEQVGIELGSLKRDAASGHFQAYDIKTDTNGVYGLSSPLTGEIFSIDIQKADKNARHDHVVISSKLGKQMTFGVTFSRTIEGELLQGAWSTSSELKAGSGMFVFDEPLRTETKGIFAGAFNLLDPTGHVQCTQAAAKPGVERGTYRLNTSGTMPVLSFFDLSVDTNGCSGIQSGTDQLIGPYNITMEDPDTMVLTPVAPKGSDDKPFKLYKIKRRAALPD